MAMIFNVIGGNKPTVKAEPKPAAKVKSKVKSRSEVRDTAVDSNKKSKTQKKVKSKASTKVEVKDTIIPKKVSKALSVRTVEKVDRRVQKIARSTTAISKLDRAEDMNTIIGDSAENIHQLLEEDRTDEATKLIYKKMVQTIVDLIPLAEKQIRNTEGSKGVYQINSLIQSMRELMTDIQAAQDRGSLGVIITQSILQPLFTSMAQFLVTEISMLKEDVKSSSLSSNEVSKMNEAIRNIQANIGQELVSKFNEMSSKITDFLQR